MRNIKKDHSGRYFFKKNKKGGTFEFKKIKDFISFLFVTHYTALELCIAFILFYSTVVLFLFFFFFSDVSDMKKNKKSPSSRKAFLLPKCRRPFQSLGTIRHTMAYKGL